MVTFLTPAFCLLLLSWSPNYLNTNSTCLHNHFFIWYFINISLILNCSACCLCNLMYYDRLSIIDYFLRLWMYDLNLLGFGFRWGSCCLFVVHFLWFCFFRFEYYASNSYGPSQFFFCFWALDRRDLRQFSQTFYFHLNFDLQISLKSLLFLIGSLILVFLLMNLDRRWRGSLSPYPSFERVILPYFKRL